MSLEIANTVLNAAPYFDDYNPEKNFHRILFRPAVAVQARELTQLQTILQNQVERFGSHIFKDGSVVSGCSIEYVPNLAFVGVVDQFTTNTALSTTDAVFANAVIIGANSGVQATVFSAVEGFVEQDPAKFFIRYTKPGFNNEQVFIPGEAISFYREDQTYIETVVLAVANATGFANGLLIDGLTTGARGSISDVDTLNNLIKLKNVRRAFEVGETVVLTTNNNVNSAVSSVSYDVSNLVGTINTLPNTHPQFQGNAYGAVVSEGIIFHKGHFIRVDQHAVIVNPANNNPEGFLLGFETAEQIVTETGDPSLYDNALGSSNFNAPGAHRLKLTSTLVSKTSAEITPEDNFFPVVEFSQDGATFERTDPAYARLGDEIARRTFEESGHYIVSPFGISSNTDTTAANNVVYNIARGIAYVKGRRVELKNTIPVVGRRGTDTVSYDEQLLFMEYGNYIDVKEHIGFFPVSLSPEVELYDTAATAVTSKLTTSSAPVGTLIGRANIRNVQYIPGSGAKGSPGGTWRMYFFNIRMESGATFANVKSVVYNVPGSRAFADAVGEFSAAANATITVLKESNRSAMIFDLGARAVKSLVNENDVADTNYFYTAANTTASMANTGVVTFSIPSGGGQIGFGTSNSSTVEPLIDLVFLQQANTITLGTGNPAAINATHSTITSVNIGNEFVPGDLIDIDGAGSPHLVTAIVNSSVIQILGLPTGSNQSYQRVHLAGSIVSLQGDARFIASNDGSTVTINLGASYTTSANVAVRIYARQNQGDEILKDVRRNTVVKIDTATHPNGATGPWNLGLPDVFKLRRITTGNSTFDVSSDFILESGQTDTHYDHASIRLIPRANTAALTNTTLNVYVDHFVANSLSGEGFFSVDSYPVDDSTSANTEVTIKTAEIPFYTSTSLQKTIDLRDVIDFRPYKVATANVTQAESGATVNPVSNNNFNPVTTTFNPFPGQNFECNFTHYLPRKDLLVLNASGTFSVVEGVSDLLPRTPEYSPDTLLVASVDVSPYPSLTDNERRVFANYPFRIKISTLSNKRFTMKDISTLEQRIARLEYYTSLTLLEKAATDLNIPSEDGTDRFKNGIFVDPFTSHAFGKVNDPQYKIAIDEQNGFARPQFHPEFFTMEFDATNSVGVKKQGNAVLLNYTDELFLDQPYATDARAAKPTVPSFSGGLDIRPAVVQQVEVLASPISVAVNDRPSEAYADMYNAPYASKYGWWRGDVGWKPQPITDDLRDGAAPIISASIITTGNESSDATIIPYMKSDVIAFRAYGLKPNTRHFIYIDNRSMEQFSAPGNLANAGAFDAGYVSRTEPWGTPLFSDSRGELYGKISIPEATFSFGRHVVTITTSATGATAESFASGSFESTLDISYPGTPPPPAPPPPILRPQPPIDTTIPPAPAPPPQPPTPELFISPSYSASGETSVQAPANHVMTFRDASIVQNGTINSYQWSFGAGASPSSATGAGPHTVTYSTTDSVQDVFVSLTVTATSTANTSIVRSATAESSFKLYKLPAPQPPPVGTGKVSIIVTDGNNPTGTNLIQRDQTAGVVFYATYDGPAGGSISWGISNESGTGTIVPSSSNDVLTVVTSGPTNKTFDVTATHSSGNSAVVTGISLVTAPAPVIPPPPIILQPVTPSTGYLGGGGWADDLFYTNIE